MTTLDEFSAWFRREAKRLSQLSPQDAVTEVEGALRGADPRLSVEVSDGDRGRLMIVTARSNRDAFSAADRVVSLIAKEEGWTIQALKLALGFEFEIEMDGTVLKAAELHFEPMSLAKRPGELGVMVFVPGELANKDNIVETVWLVLETGVGERAVTRIAHVVVADELEAPSGALGIEDLGDYIDWHYSKKPTTANSSAATGGASPRRTPRG
jgi:hypothetical protein